MSQQYVQESQSYFRGPILLISVGHSYATHFSTTINKQPYHVISINQEDLHNTDKVQVWNVHVGDDEHDDNQ